MEKIEVVPSSGGGDPLIVLGMLALIGLVAVFSVIAFRR